MMEILLLDLLFETEELLHTFYLKMTIGLSNSEVQEQTGGLAKNTN